METNYQTTNPEEIDPYTLFLGNLPTKLTIENIKEICPNAKSYDLGYAAKTKFTKYVFICYENVDDAIEAFKKNYNRILGNRNILIRFRRCRNILIMKPNQDRANKKENCDNTIKNKETSTTGMSSGHSENTISSSSVVAKYERNLIDQSFESLTHEDSTNLTVKETIEEVNHEILPSDNEKKTNTNEISEIKREPLKMEPEEEENDDEDLELELSNTCTQNHFIEDNEVNEEEDDIYTSDDNENTDTLNEVILFNDENNKNLRDCTHEEEILPKRDLKPYFEINVIRKENYDEKCYNTEKALKWHFIE